MAKTSCKMLKRRIKTAKGKRKRGKALAAYRHTCTKGGKRRKR